MTRRRCQCRRFGWLTLTSMAIGVLTLRYLQPPRGAPVRDQSAPPVVIATLRVLAHLSDNVTKPTATRPIVIINPSPLAPSSIAAVHDEGSSHASSHFSVFAAEPSPVAALRNEANSHDGDKSVANDTTCEPRSLRVRTALSRKKIVASEERTCSFATRRHDLLIGVWHSQSTEHRIRYILDSWFVPGVVVFLTQHDRPSEGRIFPMPTESIVATGAPSDDYLGTLEKGLLGLRAMFLASPHRQWYFVVGDDNYINMDRLAHTLSALDSRKELCVSEGSFFRPAEPIPAECGYDGFRMIGGAGIGTSAALTRELVHSGDLQRWANESFIQRSLERSIDMRRYYGMHDLFFGNALFDRGNTLLHIDGIFSQAPGFYAAKVHGMLSSAERLLLIKSPHSTRGLAGYCGMWRGEVEALAHASIYHHVTGPFQQWLGILLSSVDAARARRDQTQREVRAVSTRRAGRVLVLVLPLASNISPDLLFVLNDLDRSIKYEETRELRYQTLVSEKLLGPSGFKVEFLGGADGTGTVRSASAATPPCLHDLVRGAARRVYRGASPPEWLLIIPRDVYVVPAALIELIDQLATDDGVRHDNATSMLVGANSSGGILVQTSLASSLPSPDATSNTMQCDDDKSSSWQLSLSIKLGGVVMRDDDDADARSLATFMASKVTLPLWLPTSTSSALHDLCVIHAFVIDKNDPTGVDARPAVVDRVLTHRLPCAISEQLIIAHTAFGPHPRGRLPPKPGVAEASNGRIRRPLRPKKRGG